MRPGYKYMEQVHAVKLIREITGFQYFHPGQIYWAEYSETDKILLWEDEDEIIWELNCSNGMSRSRYHSSDWSKWAHNFAANTETK